MPNIVTYNTLIDVYGKLGQWQEALGVLETLRMEVGSRGPRFSSKLQPAPSCADAATCRRCHACVRTLLVYAIG